LEKTDIRFEDFLMEAEPSNLDFILELHDYLLQNGCDVKIQAAKSGYVVSYSHSKKVIANYVFRKKGLIIRIYGDHVGEYSEFLGSLPDEMAESIEKAPVCRRLVDPLKCNSRCPMGYAFTLRGTPYQKRRYGSFMFLVDDNSSSYIKAFLENELRER